MKLSANQAETVIKEAVRKAGWQTAEQDARACQSIRGSSVKQGCLREQPIPEARDTFTPCKASPAKPSANRKESPGRARGKKAKPEKLDLGAFQIKYGQDYSITLEEAKSVAQQADRSPGQIPVHRQALENCLTNHAHSGEGTYVLNPFHRGDMHNPNEPSVSSVKNSIAATDTALRRGFRFTPGSTHFQERMMQDNTGDLVSKALKEATGERTGHPTHTRIYYDRRSVGHHEVSPVMIVRRASESEAQGEIAISLRSGKELKTTYPGTNNLVNNRYQRYLGSTAPEIQAAYGVDVFNASPRQLARRFTD